MSTFCHNIVKQILYNSSITTPSLEYGKAMEAVAINKFENENGLTVHKAGFFIDLTYGYLGASLDGLVGTTHLVEMKCLHKVFKLNISLDEAVEKHNICLEKHNNNYGCSSFKIIDENSELLEWPLVIISCISNYTGMDEELLISLVQNYKELYDLQNPHYDDLQRRNNIWEEIAGILKLPGVTKKNNFFFVEQDMK